MGAQMAEEKTFKCQVKRPRQKDSSFISETAFDQHSRCLRGEVCFSFSFRNLVGIFVDHIFIVASENRENACRYRRNRKSDLAWKQQPNEIERERERRKRKITELGRKKTARTNVTQLINVTSFVRDFDLCPASVATNGSLPK